MTDYTGMAILVSSGLGGIAAIIAAIAGLRNTGAIKQGTDQATNAATQAATAIAAVHDEIKSPNGSTTGEAVTKTAETIEQVATDLNDLRHEQAALSIQLGSHMSDGHGSKQ